ncbi:MAG: hypothetical protein ACLGJC_25155 [Alphaproteobacteria bacterium]
MAAEVPTPTNVVDAAVLKRIAENGAKDALAKHGGGPHDPGMDDAWRNKVDGRLDGLEKAVEGLKGSLDGLKIAASALTAMVGVAAAVLGGFVYFSAASMSARMDRVEAKVDTLGSRITEEFRSLRTDMAADARAMRAEQSAQTSAIANAITATKQQAPQVILVPAPQVQQPATPQQ